MNVAVLASGSLGFRVLKEIMGDMQIHAIATDPRSMDVKSLGENKNIPVFSGNPRRGELHHFFQSSVGPVDLIISINYIYLLEKDIIEYPIHYCLNIHGSMLPKYRGRSPHIWAIINNEQYTGITLHVIDEGCDTGPIVAQQKIPISSTITGGGLLNMFEKWYPSLILKTFKKVEAGTIEFCAQDESKATYFGKRSPADGEINWNWHKERIRNWVRAQAAPYPGAFSFIDGKKLIIDKIKYFQKGFSFDMPNGLIVGTRPVPLVKVPNGVVALEKTRGDINAFDLTNKVLGK